MFQVEGFTITMSRGDTGSVVIRATGHTFGADDRAMFTLKSAEGTVVKQGVYPIDDAGRITVPFLNAETDYLAPGTYKWDVRYVIHPYYNDDGDIVDGDQVITPKLPQTLELLPAVGEI